MISIIIPIYNRGHQLGRCLESILNQTYKNYEVIIVNDGSTDNSAEVINSYRERFGINLNVYEQKKQGAQAARNYGAKHAHGELLLFCDADVIMAPSMLKIMHDTISREKQAAYVYSNFIWVKKKFRLEKFSSEKLKTMPYIHTCSLIRKEYFPGFDLNIKKFQDWDLWLTILEKGGEGVWIDQYLFRKQSGGTMSSWLPSFAYKLLPFLPAVKRYHEAKAIIINKHHL